MSYKKEVLPYNETASINYSIIGDFRPINIFRLFCVSLYRDRWYYSRVPLKYIAELTRMRTAGNFTTELGEYLNKKHYYAETGVPDITPKRNLYIIPPMDIKCITVHHSFVELDIDSSVKGLLIQLKLLQTYGKEVVTTNLILSKIKITKPTLNKYLLQLQLHNLVSIKTNGEIIVLENEYFSPPDFSQQKISSKRELELQYGVPNIIFTPKSKSEIN